MSDHVHSIEHYPEHGVGKPSRAQFTDKIVAAIKWVDGTVIDCVRQVE